MRSYSVLLKWIFERLSSFITNCHKVVYNKKINSHCVGDEQITYFYKLPPFPIFTLSEDFTIGGKRKIMKSSLSIYFLLLTMPSAVTFLKCTLSFRSKGCYFQDLPSHVCMAPCSQSAQWIFFCYSGNNILAKVSFSTAFCSLSLVYFIDYLVL